MADPVSNHQNAIATKGTKHVARADPHADVCWIDKPKTTYPADNHQPSTKLKTKSTADQKTLIEGSVVWIQPSILDEIHSLDPHPGKQGGKVSTTYCKFAHATTFSKDVKLEGFGVVRSFDKTEQNGDHGIYNCHGFVDPSALDGKVDAAADAARKRCTVKSLKGKCKHGREIDSEKNRYELDIIGGDEVKFEAERIAQGPPEGKSPCKKHTKFSAERTWEGKTTKEEKLADEWEIKGKLTEDPASPLVAGAPTKSESAIGAAGSKNKYDEAGGDAEGYDATKGKGFSDAAKERQKAQIENRQAGDWNRAADKQILHPEDHYVDKQTINTKEKSNLKPGSTNMGDKPWAEAANTAYKDYNALLEFLKYKREPPTVVVTAMACAGPMACTVRVFPEEAIKFDLFSKAINSKLQAINDVGQVLVKVSNLLGQKYEWHFLENPTLTLEAQFKELTKEKNDRHPWEVWPKYSLNFSFEPLLRVAAKYTISILTFAGFIGRAAAWILEKVGAEGNFFLSGQVAFSPKFTASRDEYKDGKVDGVTLKLVLDLKLGVELFGGGGGISASATLYGYATATIELINVVLGKTLFIESDIHGKVQLGIKGAVNATVWGWSTSKEIDWAPEEGKKEFEPPTKLPPLPWQFI